MICAVNVVNVGTCIGDSGGGLVSAGYLAGITTWGIPCGTEYPDVYTRISYHAYWITTNAI